MRDILMTSGYNFEGYEITEYLGFCSGECVLGTGFLSLLNVGIADIFGTSSTVYEGKLDKAKNMAISELKNKVRNLGANAIIGLDVDYTTFTADVMGVVASGTAIIIEKVSNKSELTVTLMEQKVLGDKTDNIVTLPVISYYMDIPIRPYSVSYDIQRECIQIVIHNIKQNKIWGMNLDIIFNTIFNTSYEYQDINFISIETEHVMGRTEYVKLIIPGNQIKIINSVSIRINNYIDGEVVLSPVENYNITSIPFHQLLDFRKKYGNDVVCDFSTNKTLWQCICGYENSEVGKTCALCGRTQNMYEASSKSSVSSLIDLLPVLETLPRAKDILIHITEEKVSLDEQLLKELDNVVSLERMYGSMKSSCIAALKKYIENYQCDWD